MGTSQGTLYQHQDLHLPNQISDDIGKLGFDGDDVLDMQMRIGSYSGLKRRLNTMEGERLPKEDTLFSDLISPGDYSYRAQSTQESLSGLDMQLFSEEDLHH